MRTMSLKLLLSSFVCQGVDYTASKDNNLVVFNAPSSGQTTSKQTFQHF
ncbi:hypothetical protein [Flavobacterium sp. FlaQc-50]